MTGVTGWGIISTVLFGSFVGYQYFDSKWKSRIERSLEYSVLYQAQDKVAARNATDLWPPIRVAEARPDDADRARVLMDRLNELGIVGVVIDPEVGTGVDALTEVATDLANSKSTTPNIDQAPRRTTFPDSVACEDSIASYVKAKLDKQDNSQYKETYDEGLKNSTLATEWGIVAKTEEWISDKKEKKLEKTYWLYQDVGFYYTLPLLLTTFFVVENKAEGMELCIYLVNEFEREISKTSSQALGALHELKHFYAAVSICTTSGLCDSLVACEIFSGDMYRFHTSWRQYFEIWAASKGEVEYWRLPRFISHCNSNKLLDKYSKGELTLYYEAPLFYMQNFWNMW